LAEEKKKLIDKVGNYAKYVKEMYWPKVSEAKKTELEMLKENPRSQKVRRSVANLKSNGPVSKLMPILGSARNKKGNPYNNSDTEEANNYYAMQNQTSDLNIS
jgi:hypothetical protein